MSLILILEEVSEPMKVDQMIPGAASSSFLVFFLLKLTTAEVEEAYKSGQIHGLSNNPDIFCVHVGRNTRWVSWDESRSEY